VILPYSSSGLKVSCNIFYKVNDLNQEFVVHININLHRLVKRYLTQWPRDGQVLSGAFFYCSTEGDIEQDRNRLGIVCCKWHHKILSFRVTREILVQLSNMYLARAGNHGAVITPYHGHKPNVTNYQQHER